MELTRNNLHLGFRSYKLERLRNLGEYDLTNIAQKARREAEWVYDNSGVWIYKRSKHSENRDGMSSSARYEQVKDLWTTQNGEKRRLTHYHIHPSIGINNFLKRAVAEKTPYFESLDKEQLVCLGQVYLSVPSECDVRYFAHCYQFPFEQFGLATEKGITRITFGEGPVDIRIPTNFSQQWTGKRFKDWFKDHVNKLNQDFDSLVNNLFHEINVDIEPMSLTFIPRSKLSPAAN